MPRRGRSPGARPASSSAKARPTSRPAKARPSPTSRPAKASRSPPPASRPAKARSPSPKRVYYSPSPSPSPDSPKRKSEGSMTGAMFRGMAFGVGASIAHAVLLGPRKTQHEKVASEAAPASAAAVPAGSSPSESEAACGMQSKPFQDLLQCLDDYANDISNCQFYMDMLSECRRNSGKSKTMS